MAHPVQNETPCHMQMDSNACFLDEFRHNSASNEEEVDNPKQLLGSRIRCLRLFRKMTQEEAAEKAGINTALWRHYELGMRMPRQDRLEKIAEVLRVPVQMLQPIDTYSSAGIATVLYNMRMQYKNPEIVEIDGETYIKIPKNDLTRETRAVLKEIQNRLNQITFEDAMEYYFGKFNPAPPKEVKEHAQINIERYKAYLNGKTREELGTYDEELALSINRWEWRLKNKILMDYITELYDE